jgi:putative membrane protein
VLLAAYVVVALIALLHVYILVLEMFLWQAPRTRTVFGTTPELAAATVTLAGNQGLYNGFLAAGLFVALLAGGPATDVGLAFSVFFLICVLVAGIYGAATVGRRVLYAQTAPATIGLVLVMLAR